MANKIQIKAKELEVIASLYEELERMEKNELEEYRKLDELEQKTSYNCDTHNYELVWEDAEQTIPVMVNKWGTVTRTYDELTEMEQLKVDAIRKVKTYLEKAI